MTVQGAVPIMRPIFQDKQGGMKEHSLDRAREAAAGSLAALVEDHGQDIEALATLLVEKFHLGRRLFLVGSGPLAAVASLAASLFQHRLTLNRPPLPVIALGDAVLATSLLRDGLGRQVFSRPLRVQASPDDLLLALCEGVRDDAVDEALDTAREIGCETAVLASRKW